MHAAIVRLIPKPSRVATDDSCTDEACLNCRYPIDLAEGMRRKERGITSVESHNESRGISFAAPANYVRSRRNDHETFYCPNGHAAAFTGKSEAERLREQLASERHAQSRRLQFEATRREAVERERDAAIRKVKRVERGVCPHCQRSFVKLAAHVKTKHPECLG